MRSLVLASLLSPVGGEWSDYFSISLMMHSRKCTNRLSPSPPAGDPSHNLSLHVFFYPPGGGALVGLQLFNRTAAQCNAGGTLDEKLFRIWPAHFPCEPGPTGSTAYLVPAPVSTLPVVGERFCGIGNKEHYPLR